MSTTVLPQNIRVDRNCQPTWVSQNATPEEQEPILFPKYKTRIFIPELKTKLDALCKFVRLNHTNTFVLPKIFSCPK